MYQVSRVMGHVNRKGYHKLNVWSEAHKLVLMVYKSSEDFPRTETMGLTSQLRRAAVSVPANIVEGHVKNSKKEFLLYLDHANGSLVEVEYYFELAQSLKFLTDEQYEILENQRTIVGNLLHGFIKALKSPKHDT